VCVCRGDTPSEVELMYLENAQMLALYGLHMHPAKVSSSVLFSLNITTDIYISQYNRIYISLCHTELCCRPLVNEIVLLLSG